MSEAAATMEADLAIIGSGGGAFAAAIRATDLGRSVVIIERSTVGGTCVNTGCVPSKALPAASTPVVPDVEGLEQVEYLTSTTAMEVAEVPASLLIIGGGYVGLEQAQIFARLGSAVTMVVRSRPASGEEPEVSRTVTGVFAEEGVRVVRRTTVISVTTDPDTGDVIVTVTVTGPGGQEILRAARLMVAVGRRPVTDRLNLGPVGVDAGARGGIIVDARMNTTSPRVWAAGDVTGHPQYVYVASAHGVTALARDAGETAAAGVYVVSARMTVDQLATLWCPCLTMGEGQKIAARKSWQAVEADRARTEPG